MNLEQKTPIKIIGIDSDEAAIKKAEDLKNLFGATNIEFVSINFEEFVEQFGVKSHNFFCFGFGVERSDIIARIYLNPSNNYIWTLAPIFNEKLEQDLCLIAPKYDKSGTANNLQKLEELLKKSKLPLDLSPKIDLDENYCMYK